MKLSVAIVAANESANLGRTLESVAWADEIVVLDSGSTDNTVEIAKRHGAQVYVEPWKGYGAQVNSAIDKCTSPWIFSLDADEVLTPELQLEIQGLLAGKLEFQAYTVPRLNRIFGRWMKHGGLYPDRKLRLFEAGTARLPEDTEPHATPKWKGPAGKLKHDLLHYQYPTIQIYLEHMDRYSTASVPLLLRRGKTSSTAGAFVVNAVLNPVATFVYNYILRLGFLDGREGLVFHLYHSTYVNQKYVKAWIAAKAIHPAASPPDDAQIR